MESLMIFLASIVFLFSSFILNRIDGCTGQAYDCLLGCKYMPSQTEPARRCFVYNTFIYKPQGVQGFTLYPTTGSLLVLKRCTAIRFNNLKEPTDILGISLNRLINECPIPTCIVNHSKNQKQPNSRSSSEGGYVLGNKEVVSCMPCYPAHKF